MENNNEPLLYRFIKCSDRLPEQDGVYITKDKDNEVTKFYFCDEYPIKWEWMRGNNRTGNTVGQNSHIVEWLEPYTPPVAPEAAPVKSAEEIIRERYPFYDPTINGKDVELCGEQVQKLMERYLEVNSSSTPIAGEKNNL